MTRSHEVIVIGSGFAGLCTAIELKRAGIDDFVILEKAHQVGGTWRENTYPGAACDVMSLMYSLSFAPNPGWTRGYATQPEILDYLIGVARDYGLSQHLVFGQEVVSTVFDDDSDSWTVSTAGGERYRGRVVVAGTGPLHIPKVPQLAGADGFSGKAFHSARWDHSVDFTGKSVAVIGTGASAVQFIPVLAEQAANVTVCQRTPHWVLPKPDRPITAPERAAYRAVPGLRRLVRSGIYLSHEAITKAFLEPKYMPVLRAVAKAHLRRQVRDPHLRAQLTPDYEIGCKRLLIASDYYPALQKPNVSLVTTGIDAITAKGVRFADGTEVAADIIIYATGFAVTDKMREESLVGADGLTIQQAWSGGVESYMGVATRGFPSYFTLLGPNTGTGNQSVVFMIESQARYIVKRIKAMRDREYTRIEVKAHVQADFNREMQHRSDGTVWTAGGCTSWYLDEAGANRTIWPGQTLSFWNRARRQDLRDFEYSRLGEREEDDDYRGPAVLTMADGTELEVDVHLLAVFQPVDNAVHWTGRVTANPEVAAQHVRTNQAVRLRIGDRDAVDATLVDSDPWGGVHIVGKGMSPYRMPMEKELAQLLADASQGGSA